MFRRTGWISTLFSLAAALVATSSASAAPPFLPIWGVDYQANQAFVGDAVLGMEAGEAGSLFGDSPDLANHMASTTKSFTLLLAVEAVEAGYVDLDDLVLISAKAAGINNGHASGSHTNEGLTAGVLLRFEDLLYSMIHSSAGDSSIAIAQHVAVAIDPSLAKESAPVQEAAFTDMMNARAAELGLLDTIFFNAYGGNHTHFADNTPGPVHGHSASARDMARWFAFGMEIPLFREVVGFDGAWSMPSYNSLNIYSIEAIGGGSYPGITGGKGGSGGGCGSCMIVSARRIGRELTVAYTQGQAGTGVALLDYGFASLFHPTLEAESAPWNLGWESEDLACLADDRAVSAIVGANGDTTLRVWDVDVDGGQVVDAHPVVAQFDPVGELQVSTREERNRQSELVEIASTESDSGVFSGATAESIAISGETSRQTQSLASPSGGEPGSGPSATDEEATPVIEPTTTAARIASLGLGRVAVLEETDFGMQLSLHGIDTDDQPFMMDYEALGEGTDVSLIRVHAPSGDYVITSSRRSDGMIELRSFRVDPVIGLPGYATLSNPIDLDVVQGFQTASLAPLGDTATRFVAVGKTSGGGRAIVVLQLDSATGEIDMLGSWSFAAVSDRVSAQVVPGFGNRTIVALAFVNGFGQPSVEVLEIDAAGEIDSLGKQASDRDIAPDEPLRSARYLEGGIVLVYQDGASQWIESWSLDAAKSGSEITPAMIGREFNQQEGLHGVCRIPGNAAEADLLITYGDPAASGGRVQAWRSAPRQ